MIVTLNLSNCVDISTYYNISIPALVVDVMHIINGVTVCVGAYMLY